MNEMRKIASAYYEKADVEERKKVIAFFNKLDSNDDGRITFEEYNKSVYFWYSDERIFEKLDANGDGKLDFLDVLVLYYMEKKSCIHKCNCCRDLLLGPYFTCSLCFGVGRNSFDICSDCYEQGRFEHQHSLSNFLDHQALLASLMNMTRTTSPEDRYDQEKKEMNELREIAQTHYGAAPQNVQQLANDFFNSMDTDGDDKVDLQEFLSFMKQEGYTNMSNPHFFKLLDKDSNGKLDFTEVLTLYYILKSGRPFCDCCGKFIPGIFFSCVECFKHRESSYHLCRDCYGSKKSKHDHNGRSQFLDNYTMLEVKRDTVHQPTVSSTQISSSVVLVRLFNASVPSTAYVANPQNNALAIVPARKTDKWKTALKAFEMGTRLGILGATACSIL